jgi:Tol biopolymer transport system component
LQIKYNGDDKMQSIVSILCSFRNNLFVVFFFLFIATNLSQQLSLKQLSFSDSTHDGYPYWSPDGRFIIYSSGTGSYCTTMKVPSEGGKPIRLTDYFSQHTQWSPDGYYLIFDGEKPMQLTFLDGRQTKPSLSPDDSLLVFSSNHGGNPDLWIMNSNGGIPIQITFFQGDENNPGFDVEPSWSSDGKRIAFSSTRTDSWAVWIMEIDLDFIKGKLNAK